MAKRFSKDTQWSVTCLFEKDPKIPYYLSVRIGDLQRSSTQRYLKKRWTGIWREKLIQQMTRRGGHEMSLETFNQALLLGAQALGFNAPCKKKNVPGESMEVVLNLFRATDLGLGIDSWPITARRGDLDYQEKRYLILTWKKNKNTVSCHFPLPLVAQDQKSSDHLIITKETRRHSLCTGSTTPNVLTSKKLSMTHKGVTSQKDSTTPNVLGSKKDSTTHKILKSKKNSKDIKHSVSVELGKDSNQYEMHIQAMEKLKHNVHELRKKLERVQGDSYSQQWFEGSDFNCERGSAKLNTCCKKSIPNILERRPWALNEMTPSSNLLNLEDANNATSLCTDRPLSTSSDFSCAKMLHKNTSAAHPFRLNTVRVLQSIDSQEREIRHHSLMRDAVKRSRSLSRTLRALAFHDPIPHASRVLSTSLSSTFLHLTVNANCTKDNSPRTSPSPRLPWLRSQNVREPLKEFSRCSVPDTTCTRHQSNSNLPLDFIGAKRMQPTNELNHPTAVQRTPSTSEGLLTAEPPVPLTDSLREVVHETTDQPLNGNGIIFIPASNTAESTAYRTPTLDVPCFVHEPSMSHDEFSNATEEFYDPHYHESEVHEKIGSPRCGRQSWGVGRIRSTPDQSRVVTKKRESNQSPIGGAALCHAYEMSRPCTAALPHDQGNVDHTAQKGARFHSSPKSYLLGCSATLGSATPPSLSRGLGDITENQRQPTQANVTQPRQQRVVQSVANEGEKPLRLRCEDSSTSGAHGVAMRTPALRYPTPRHPGLVKTWCADGASWSYNGTSTQLKHDTLTQRLLSLRVKLLEAQSPAWGD